MPLELQDIGKVGGGTSCESEEPFEVTVTVVWNPKSKGGTGTVTYRANGAYTVAPSSSTHKMVAGQEPRTDTVALVVTGPAGQVTITAVAVEQHSLALDVTASGDDGGTP